MTPVIGHPVNNGKHCPYIKRQRPFAALNVNHSQEAAFLKFKIHGMAMGERKMP
jgi:hypothetical protein